MPAYDKNMARHDNVPYMLRFLPSDVGMLLVRQFLYHSNKRPRTDHDDDGPVNVLAELDELHDDENGQVDLEAELEAADNPSIPAL
ncbi:MAG: hypothetical protein M1826_003012 [Phylliscum demangeonii]|nr:MAG: hypothetical protein M1826_003012 [Phylliscum demangeonii]